MNQVLWLSQSDVEKTGVCDLKQTVPIVENTFRLFDAGQAKIVPESALRVAEGDLDQACYCLPAYVGGQVNVCGLKWSAHGQSTDPAYPDQSRIQAAILLTDPDRGVPLAVMNGTRIGAARTGAVTAVALSRLAPIHTKKVALCGAGGQAEFQLQAVLQVFPKAREVAVWSRGQKRNRILVQRYQSKTAVKLTAAESLEEAVEGADVVIGATSASTPYLLPEHLKTVSLYCHIGFNEISASAVNSFDHIVVDTWEEAKDVSGQSLFRLYRQGLLDPERITGTLGAIVTGRKNLPRATPESKILFDAFGLPIFDLSVAAEAFRRGADLGLGTVVPW